MKKALLTFLALSLTACSVGPDYSRPDVPVPQGWGASAAEQWPSLDWWRGFGSPQLDTLMDEAGKANFDIKAASARVRQADAQAKISGASLLPSVQASIAPQRSRIPATSVSQSKGAAPVGTNLYNGVFAASYEVDFWGRNADSVAAAEASAKASRYDLETARLTVQADVANTTFSILALQDRLKVAKDNLAIAETVLDSIKARVAVGTAAGLDVAQQESVVAEQRAALPPLVQALRQNGVTLAILAGKLPEEVHLPEGSLEALHLPAVGPGLPSDLLDRRPDVRFAEAQLIAANANIKAAHAAIFPSVTLTAEGGLESLALANLLKPSSVLYSLAASAVQPIFEGGVLEGGIQLEEGRWDELVQDYRKAAVNAFGDVEDGLIAVEMTAQQEDAERVAVDTGRRAYEISQAQLFGGTVDIVVVLNTQRSLFQAQDLLVQAKLAHAQAVVGLFRALGGGWRTL